MVLNRLLYTCVFLLFVEYIDCKNDGVLDIFKDKFQQLNKHTKNGTTTRQLLLISSSNVHGYGFLEQPRKYIEQLLNKNGVKEVLFVPYASRDHDAYTIRVRKVFEEWGYQVQSIHKAPSQVQAVLGAEAIFIGGGNTFTLLKSLYDNNLIEPIKQRVLYDGLPYISTSAGTNVATLTIRTTNDMPIVYPPSFDSLRLVPFQINPHYVETPTNSTHQGETRDQRINEFLEYEDVPVLGIREGVAVQVVGNQAKLVGSTNARLFRRGSSPVEYKPDSDISFLMK